MISMHIGVWCLSFCSLESGPVRMLWSAYPCTFKAQRQQVNIAACLYLPGSRSLFDDLTNELAACFST